MNIDDLKIDLLNCNMQIIFWERIKTDKNYSDLFSLSEIEELIFYYKDMKEFILKEIEKNEKNK